MEEAEIIILSLRASAHTGVAIPKGFRNIRGIATPACGLVRDDILFFKFLRFADSQLVTAVILGIFGVAFDPMVMEFVRQ